MIRQMKRIAPALIALAAVSACNTIAGLGKDLQAGGEAISQASREVREDVGGEAPAERASND